MDGRLRRRTAMFLRALLRRRAAARELDEELQFHFEQMAAAAAANGAAPDEALRQARRQFGSMTRVREACRDMSPIRSLEQLVQDVRFGARLLLRSPAFSTVAVLSLAVGIGANTAVFSLIDAVVLRPLPVERPGELYLIEAVERSNGDTRFSYPLAEAVREATAGRAEVCALSGIQRMQAADPGAPPEPANVQLVSADCFSLLRQRAQQGRLLGPADLTPGAAHPAVVLSDSYWSRRFGRTPVVGRELIVNGAAVTVAGVAAPDFRGATSGSRVADLWAPVTAQSDLRYAGNVSTSSGGDTDRPWPPQREVRWLNLLLRVPDRQAPAVTEALNLTAQRDFAQFVDYASDPDSRARLQATRLALTPGAGGVSDLRTRLTTPLLVLLLMVGTVLAVACANLAGLLLARASHRSREMAVRLSIGAGRGRLVRQLVTESLLVASIGGALGFLAARWGTALLVGIANRGGPATGIDVQPDWRVLMFTAGLSLGTGLLFGLLPALRATTIAPTEALKGQTRGAAGPGRGTAVAGRVLIATQIACSLVLLTAAVLFGRSLQQMMRVDVGFDRDRVLVARIDPRAGGYDPGELPALHRRIVDRLSAVPGVSSVSLSLNGPFGGSRWMSGLTVPGYTPAPNERPVTYEEVVTPGYFETVGLPIVLGRDFRDTDVAASRQVTVVNETWVRHFLGNANPIGHRWSYGADDEAFEIIGVVRDARYNDVTAGAVDMAYHLAGQYRGYLSSVELRAAGDPGTLARTVQQTLREAEPRLPVVDVESLADRIARSFGQERLLAWATTLFGAIALALACLGLYGTISYAVTRRTTELAVRMALGADRGSVRRLILKDALALVAAGLAIGLPLAALAARGLRGLLYAVPALDPPSYGLAAAALVTIATAAAYIPARRASRLDPATALRAE
jgi:predicted permease